MAATEGDRRAQLRIGGWLPEPDPDQDVPDGSSVTELIPRVRDGGPMAFPQHEAPQQEAPQYEAPQQEAPSRRTHEIQLGVIAPAITDADESRHRRHRRRPVAFVAAATVAFAVGVPLILGLAGGPTAPDEGVLPAPTTGPVGPVPLPPVLDLPPRTPTPAETPTASASAGRSTTPATRGTPASTAGTQPVNRPLVAGPGAAPSSSASRPAGTLSLEAEGDSAVRSGQAGPRGVAAASGGTVVGWVGSGAGNTLRFTGLDVPAAGQYDLVVYYCSGEVRSANVAVNGTPVTRVDFGSTGSFETVGTATVRLPLAAGPNTVEFSNPDAWAPDFDRVTLTR
jgi:hypothetical protein